MTRWQKVFKWFLVWPNVAFAILYGAHSGIVAIGYTFLGWSLAPIDHIRCDLWPAHLMAAMFFDSAFKGDHRLLSIGLWKTAGKREML